MSRKRNKPTPASQTKLFVVLLDEEKTRHFIAERDELTFSKKDNLKPHTYATFNGNGRQGSRCKGLVVLSGSKEHCETTLSLINKVNNDFAQESDCESDPSESASVIGTDESEVGEENPSEESRVGGSSGSSAPTTASRRNAIGDSSSIAASSRTTSAADTPSNTASIRKQTQSTTDVLNDISNITNANRKRKEPEEETPAAVSAMKRRPGSISHAVYEKLRRENDQLKKEIQTYRENWMSRPSGHVATYFIEIGKILSGQTATDEEEDKGEVLERICTTLHLTEYDLKSCEHDTDITKTCRAIVKRIFPNPTDRGAMLISSMAPAQLKAIQTYARMAHPAQAKAPNAILNNAIGNVFASEKRNLERKQLEKGRVSKSIGETDDEDLAAIDN